jgi:hypothetical protein
VITPPPGTALGAVAATGVLAGEALRALRRVACDMRRRDPGVVAGEYDRGYWATVLAERRWLQAATLDDFIAPPADGVRIAKVANHLVRISQAEYYRYRRDILRATLTEWAGDRPELAELGCGYGMNLFSLIGAGRWPHLAGFEISPTALEAANLIRQHFHLEDRVDFHRLDLLDAGQPSWRRLEGATAFTYYCFEQLKHSTAAALSNIIASGVRRVIHIEPTPELWKWWRPADAVSRLYSWSQDYQDNLLATLRRLEHDGTVRLLDVRRLYYAPGVRHDPTLMCWEPRG